MPRVLLSALALSGLLSCAGLPRAWAEEPARPDVSEPAGVEPGSTEAGPALPDPADVEGQPYPPDGVTDPNVTYPTDGAGDDQGEAGAKAPEGAPKDAAGSGEQPD